MRTSSPRRRRSAATTQGHRRHRTTFDHHLQELVNSKINRPIAFSYETCQLDGQTVGVITIQRKQHPPHHLLKDFGKLTKNTVYVRRGSSTAIATPDEITSLTRTTRKRRNPPTRRASLQALDLTVMHRKEEIITVRGGRGIPGFAYTPRERHVFSLGQYVRLNAKLLVTPTTPLVVVSALSSATITRKNTQAGTAREFKSFVPACVSDRAADLRTLSKPKIPGSVVPEIELKCQRL